MVKYSSFPLPKDNGQFCTNAGVRLYKCGRRDLCSYSTIVCSLLKNGEFVRKWDGYSATTMRHINYFRKRYCLETINKKEWMLMSVGA